MSTRTAVVALLLATSLVGCGSAAATSPPILDYSSHLTAICRELAAQNAELADIATLLAESAPRQGGVSGLGLAPPPVATIVCPQEADWVGP